MKNVLFIALLWLTVACCGNPDAVPAGTKPSPNNSEITILEIDELSDGKEVRYIDHSQYRIFLYGNGMDEASISVINLKKDSLEEELLKLQIEKLKQE